MTELANLADQASKMTLVQFIVSGLLNNERIWISGDDLLVYPEHVFPAYKLHRMAED